MWRQVQGKYVLDALETALLGELCRSVDVCDRIRRELAKSSLLVTGSTGQPRSNPLLQALDVQVKLVERLTSSLGLSMPEGSGKGATHQRKAARSRWHNSAKPLVTPIGGGRGAGAC